MHRSTTKVADATVVRTEAMAREGRVSPDRDEAGPSFNLDDLLAQLDDLNRAELDALPFGVIQVNGVGRVVFYSAAESRFSGRPVEAVVGRDFFRDVAPCTDQPAFRGRFLEGVRRG